ncbi:MAG: RagB/SusD family nutrient uptake outer membrane protein [Tannerella sp.]|jgi:hypothetical protein|nr:RagB/SusD family nutrient uptake outer membrane protein [Tannerella sp.]
MKEKKIFILWCISASFIVSCDYLDVVPSDIPEISHAFKNRIEAEKFLYGCLGSIPQYGSMSVNPAFLGGDEIWLPEPVLTVPNTNQNIVKGQQNTSSPVNNAYSAYGYFRGLRDCNIFLENCELPYDLGSDERNRWIAEIKFVKAYIHFYLLRQYGPMHIIRDNLPIDARGDDAMAYREPVDEVVKYIVELCDEAALRLPPMCEDIANDLGRPTAVMALALKGQALLLAASPLFNGNPDYAGIKDGRGVTLFSDTYDPNKWRLAADALKAAIDLAHESLAELYDFARYSPYSAALSEKTILSMQVRGAVTDKWNTEIIWGDSESNTDAFQRAAHMIFLPGQRGGNCTHNYGPPLHIVEQFYTKNGIPIEDDEEWLGVDPLTLRTATDDDRFYIKSGFETLKLHFDREPRFYGAITFDGGTFYGNSNILSDNAMLITECKGGGSINNTYVSGKYSATGYLCKKLTSYLSSFGTSSGLTTTKYIFPVMRLADLYLMYAEALNEVKAAPDDEVYEYIDSVRRRSGLEGVVASWQKYAVGDKKSKPLTKDGMREIIRRERLIELAFEGQRFWDLRRWKEAEIYLNKPIRGMSIKGENTADFYKVQTIFTPKFEKKDYLWPLSINNLMTNQNLIQNPGWGQQY